MCHADIAERDGFTVVIPRHPPQREGPVVIIQRLLPFAGEAVDIADAVEFICLAVTIPQSPVPSERLKITLQRLLELTQRLVNSADVMESDSFLRAVIHLLPD